MRDYDNYDDESIRLYTPILQRMMILAAVIIAVPVIMWTITTFVRSYVERPKVPLLEHAASITTPARVPLIAAPPNPTPSAPDQSATSRDKATASDATNATAEIEKAPANLAAAPDSNLPPAAATDLSTASLQAAPMQAPSPASPAPAAAAGDTSMANPAEAPAVSTPKPPQSPWPTHSATLSRTASSPDRGIAWPNPNATSAPDLAALRSALPPPPPTAGTANAEDLPAQDPIRGPVPLPRHRPSIFAMSAIMAAATAAGGPVPLPRARPGAAPTADSGAEPGAGRQELENVH